VLQHFSSHSSVDDDSSLPRCDAVLLDVSFPGIWRIVLSSSSDFFVTTWSWSFRNYILNSTATHFNTLPICAVQDWTRVAVICRKKTSITQFCFVFNILYIELHSLKTLLMKNFNTVSGWIQFDCVIACFRFSHIYVSDYNVNCHPWTLISFCNRSILVYAWRNTMFLNNG
jgi:hypothetical protein